MLATSEATIIIPQGVDSLINQLTDYNRSARVPERIPGWIILNEQSAIFDNQKTNSIRQARVNAARIMLTMATQGCYVTQYSIEIDDLPEVGQFSVEPITDNRWNLVINFQRTLDQLQRLVFSELKLDWELLEKSIPLTANIANEATKNIRFIGATRFTGKVSGVDLVSIYYLEMDRRHFDQVIGLMDIKKEDIPGLNY